MTTLTIPERLELAESKLPKELQHPHVLQLIKIGLAEDLGAGTLDAISLPPAAHDLTSHATLPSGGILDGRIFVKEDGALAGLPLAEAIFAFIDPEIEFRKRVEDGKRLEAGETLATARGGGPVILTAERLALNFLGRMSGIASLAAEFVDAVAGTGATILDTRKTAPGWRLLDKYAVRMGGAANHRMGLYDMVLVKNNHIDGAGGLEAAVAGVRDLYGWRYPIEIEVRDLEELAAALRLKPDRILLDNMDLVTMRQAVKMSGGDIPLEASGNVNLNTVRAIAKTGVDYISSGALTHSARVLDISMHVG